MMNEEETVVLLALARQWASFGPSFMRATLLANLEGSSRHGAWNKGAEGGWGAGLGVEPLPTELTRHALAKHTHIERRRP